MTACIFRLCGAFFPDGSTLIQAVPGDDELTTQMLPQHRLEGHEEFGLCPASLMYLPATAYVLAQMETQAQVLERILAEREQRFDRVMTAGTSEHSLTPHPVAGGLFGTGSAHYEQRGATVSTVAEVKKAINVVKTLVSEARLDATNCGNKVADALAKINVIRETSVDPIGAPALGRALDLADELKAACTRAIEEMETYKGSL